jgi:hypothetical protein
LGDGPETLETETDILCRMDDEEAELQLCRKKGPLGILHNIVVCIGRCPQRREKRNDQAMQFYAKMTTAAPVDRNETQSDGEYYELVPALLFREALVEFLSTAIRHNLHEAQDSIPNALKLDKLYLEE